LSHVLDHLGPPMVEWWQSFETPELTPELAAMLVEGVGDELRGVEEDAMVRERDELLELLLIAKANCNNFPTNERADR
jgi:hypothetical protein